MENTSVNNSKFASIILVSIILFFNWNEVIADVNNVASESEINAILEEAIKETEKALEYAKQSNKERTTSSITKALKQYKKIDNLELRSKLRPARNKLKSARKKIRQGDIEMTVEDLNKVLNRTQDIICCPM